MGKNLKGKELGVGFSQRKDGTYIARYKNGNVSICLYNKSLSKLRKELEQAKYDNINSLSDSSDREAKKVVEKRMSSRYQPTLDEWFEEWFTQCKSHELKNIYSQDSYKRKVRTTYCFILGQKKLAAITPIDIQLATNELIESFDKTKKSVSYAARILNECFDYAVQNRMIYTNPFNTLYIRNDNTKKKEARILDNWERELLLEEIKGDFYEEVYYFMLLTGVRIGELAGLQWDDIDFNKKSIYINHTLGTAYIDGKKAQTLETPKSQSSYRSIPFLGNIEEKILSWKQKQDARKEKYGEKWRANPEFGNLVFTSTVGSPLNKDVLRRDLIRLTKKLNEREVENARREGRSPRKIENINPHAFRHTFATMCFENDMNPVIVQRILGHASYTTTLAYTHILEKKLDDELIRAQKFNLV